MRYELAVPLLVIVVATFVLGWQLGRRMGYEEGRLHERLITLAFAKAVRARIDSGESLVEALDNAAKGCLDDGEGVVDSGGGVSRL